MQELRKSDFALDGIDDDLRIEDLRNELVQLLVQLVLRSETLRVLNYLGEVQAHKVDSAIVKLEEKTIIGRINHTSLMN